MKYESIFKGQPILMKDVDKKNKLITILTVITVNQRMKNKRALRMKIKFLKSLALNSKC